MAQFLGRVRGWCALRSLKKMKPKLLATLLTSLFVAHASHADNGSSILAGQALSSDQMKELGFIDTTAPFLSHGDRVVFSGKDSNLILEIQAASTEVKEDAIVEEASIRWTLLKGSKVTTGVQALNQNRKILTGEGGAFSSSLGGAKVQIQGVSFTWRVDDSPHGLIIDLDAGVRYHLLKNNKREQDAVANP